MTLEEMKNQADYIERRIDLWNDRLGPSDEFVLFLKGELKVINEKILDLMIEEQEKRISLAIIE